MPTATITSKGQITIPIQVRKALKLKAGDKVDIFEEADGRYVFKPKTGSIREMRGILKKMGLVPDSPPLSIEEMDKAILEHAAELDKATKTLVSRSTHKTEVA